jgi:hypothetical protein
MSLARRHILYVDAILIDEAIKMLFECLIIGAMQSIVPIVPAVA